MATADSSWMPASGRHRVSVGSSLSRALKARKGAPAPTKRSNLPSRDFYSFRYNFKPPSVDNSRPGSIDVNRGKEATTVSVELPSTQEGEAFIFLGTEEPAKELDCVLIYDEETGTFTLEKLESCVALKHDKKTASSSRRQPSASPLPPTPVPLSNAAGPIDDLEAELENMLDADGDADEQDDILPTYKKPPSEPTISLPSKPVSPPLPLPIKTKAKPKIPPPRLKPSQTKSKSVPQNRPPPPVPAPPTTVYADEEVFDFGTPSIAVKPKGQTASTSSSGGGLALPGSTSSFSLPPAPVPVQEDPAIADSDEESDWEPVATTPAIPSHIEMVEPEEERFDIDLNDLEAEMDEQLGAEDEDMSDPEPPRSGVPMSLEEFAKKTENGLQGYPSQDEDDYTSSDDTDDD